MTESLQWKDVLLMCEKFLLHGGGFETGLRSEGIPKDVIKEWWDSMRNNYVCNEILPQLKLFHQGFRRRVLVYLEEGTSDMDEALEKATKQCTSQLVIVTHSKQPGRCVQSQTCGQMIRSGLSPFAGQQVKV